MLKHEGWRLLRLFLELVRDELDLVELVLERILRRQV